ncbi:MAG: hypothetical protein ONA90_07400, partial [candidate division KSB1 bacterium]|nr:hypothetical protein [candidate division KSB1 bacterium]
IYQFLKENGASFFHDIAAGVNWSKPKVTAALAELAWAGLATNESTRVLHDLAEHGGPRQAEAEFSDSTPADWQQFFEKALPAWRNRDRHLRRRRYARRKETWRNPSPAVETLQLTEGRWSLLEAFAIWGKPTAEIDTHASASQAFSLAQQQAHLLLERYGILVKEWYRRESARAESTRLPWYALFQALKRMEWRDEVRRGYFVEGLSGVQFALSHAVEMLATADSGENLSGPTMLNLLDPAVPYGLGVNLLLKGIDGQPLPLVRQASNHLLFDDVKPVVYAENYGARLWSVAEATAQQLAASLSSLKQFLLLPDFLRPRKRIEVETWNHIPVTDTPAAAWLDKLGFEKEEKKMVLWPSKL